MSIIIKSFIQEFEEKLIYQQTQSDIIYDETQNLHVILTPAGEKIPAINSFGILDTNTATKVDKESSDSDQENCLNTQTETYEHKESTDEDNPCNYFSTETITNSKKESYDSDDPRSSLSFIETVTRASDEKTVDDDM